MLTRDTSAGIGTLSGGAGQRRGELPARAVGGLRGADRATVVGLLVGLVAVALPVSGTLVSGATVFVALVVLAALSLDAGARLGAATALIVTAIPGENPVTAALARGANVPLGCAIAVGVGLVSPRRAAARLRTDLRGDVDAAGELAHSALLVYIGDSVADDLKLRLEALVRITFARAAALRDAAHEPGGHGARLLGLQRDVDTVAALLDSVAALVGVALEAGEDRVPALVRSELRDAAEALAHATRAVARRRDDNGCADELVRLNRAVAAVDAAFALARAHRATVEFATEEIARLLATISALHHAASALLRFEGAGQDLDIAGHGSVASPA